MPLMTTTRDVDGRVAHWHGDIACKQLWAAATPTVAAGQIPTEVLRLRIPTELSVGRPPLAVIVLSH